MNITKSQLHKTLLKVLQNVNEGNNKHHEFITGWVSLSVFVERWEENFGIYTNPTTETLDRYVIQWMENNELAGECWDTIKNMYYNLYDYSNIVFDPGFCKHVINLLYETVYNEYLNDHKKIIFELKYNK